MYFSKEFLLDLYKKLSSLYSGNDIEAQGGTQFVSELKYFLAMDYFKKQKGKTCDSNQKDDKDFFVLSVGKIVLLSEDGSFLATKNFANSVGEARDFDVGSNFFSANAVAKSKISNDPQKFPNRHPQLLSITKGIIDTYSGGYENLAPEHRCIPILPQAASLNRSCPISRNPIPQNHPNHNDFSLFYRPALSNRERQKITQFLSE